MLLFLESKTYFLPLLEKLVFQRHQMVSDSLALLFFLDLPFGSSLLQAGQRPDRGSILPSSWLDLRAGLMDLKPGWLVLGLTRSP